MWSVLSYRLQSLATAQRQKNARAGTLTKKYFDLLYSHYIMLFYGGAVEDCSGAVCRIRRKYRGIILPLPNNMRCFFDKEFSLGGKTIR